MCGILGIFNYVSNENIVKETYMQLKNLQHRGRDSYGLLFYNFNEPFLFKKLNKIKIFDIIDMNIPICNITLGHTKYTTSNYRKKK